MADVKWYVVRAVSGQERKVKTYLDNEIARNGMEETIHACAPTRAGLWVTDGHCG